MTSGNQERPLIGAHVSIAGGVSQSLARGRQIGCDCIQIFTKSLAPVGGQALLGEEIEAFRSSVRPRPESRCVVAHDSYLLNLGAPDEKTAQALGRGPHRRAGTLRDARRAVSGRASGLARRLWRGGRHRDHRALDRRGAQVVRRVSRPGSRWRSLLGREAISATRSRRWGASSTRSRRTNACGCASTPSTPSPRATTCAVRKATSGRSRNSTSTIGIKRAGRLSSQRFAQALSLARRSPQHIGKGHLGVEPFERLLHDPRFCGIPMCLETEPGPDMKEIAEDLVTLRKLLGHAQD